MRAVPGWQVPFACQFVESGNFSQRGKRRVPHKPQVRLPSFIRTGQPLQCVVSIVETHGTGRNLERNRFTLLPFLFQVAESLASLPLFSRFGRRPRLLALAVLRGLFALREPGTL
jgi:hypothetical protein